MSHLRLSATLLVTSALLSACAPDDDLTAPDSSMSQADHDRFADELLALKRSPGDLSSRERLIGALVNKYSGGAAAARDQASALDVPAPVAADVNLATGRDGWNLVKDSTVPFRYTYISSATVNPGVTLTIQTAATGTADPYVILYSKQTSPKITVLGMNDDFAGLGANAKLVWKNTTTVSQAVTYVVFAYDDALRGSAAITVTNGTNKSTVTGTVAGVAKYRNNITPPNSCSGTISKVRLKTYGANGGWVENLVVMSSHSGASTRGGLAIAQTFATPTTMELDPADLGNSLPVVFDLVFSPNPPASGTVRMTQEDFLNCVVGT